MARAMIRKELWAILIAGVSIRKAVISERLQVTGGTETPEIERRREADDESLLVQATASPGFRSSLI
jgi:hypothetical protein